MKKGERVVVDIKSLPPLTDKQKAELEALKLVPDEDIDYSDIPPLDDSFLERAVPFSSHKSEESLLASESS